MRNLPQVIVLSMAFSLTACFGSGGDRKQSAPAAQGGAATTPPGDGPDPGEGAARRASNGAVTLSWYPPIENADGSPILDLAGYRIYYGKSATKLDQTVVIDNPGLTRYLVENLAPAKWHFAMTSINRAGKESARSTVVSKKIA